MSGTIPLPDISLADWLEECNEILVAMLTAKGYLDPRHAKVHLTQRALPQGLNHNRVFLADESFRIDLLVSGFYLFRYIDAIVRLSAAKVSNWLTETILCWADEEIRRTRTGADSFRDDGSA